MSEIPSNLFYTKDHEWVLKDADGSFLVGITDHAQESLGDVTFIEMPSVGERFDSGDVFGVVESVKAASDLFMPTGGEITEINEKLNDFPEKVNTDPYTDGWMIRIVPFDSKGGDSLLDHSQYSKEISGV